MKGTAKEWTAKAEADFSCHNILDKRSTNGYHVVVARWVILHMASRHGVRQRLDLGSDC